jgi:hypothetical protein
VAGEIDRARRLPRSRRVPSDLGVRVEARVDPDTAERLPRDLRRSDQWALRSGDLALLLHGCDEAGAEVALRRLGVAEVRRLTLATTNDLLVGAGA